jgi:hypothetical protein
MPAAGPGADVKARAEASAKLTRCGRSAYLFSAANCTGESFCLNWQLARRVKMDAVEYYLCSSVCPLHSLLKLVVW